jgi:hypothetical protein
MSFFKNSNMKKKEEVEVVVETTIKSEVMLVDVDNKNDIQKALIAEAVELFAKILKGYPVSDKVKVWVEKASKEL